MREIAVRVDQNGNTTTLYESGKIVVYKKQLNGWTIYREHLFKLHHQQELTELRKSMKEVMLFLGSCRVLVLSSITGVPYLELEKAGFHVWEAEGNLDELLDEVLEREEQTAAAVIVQNSAIPKPVDMGNGFYRISLCDIQKSGNGATSKQVLQAFLRNEVFYQLEVLCNHIPSWLEAEAQSGKLRCDSEKTDSGELRVLISKLVCGQ
ncbi:nitrogenase [bacterium BFN5]|nr:nitrogenase [bacterium BFN5]QJW48073.1 nitrogenase [bacterium BFN5]